MSGGPACLLVWGLLSVVWREVESEIVDRGWVWCCLLVGFSVVGMNSCLWLSRLLDHIRLVMLVTRREALRALKLE